MKKLLFISLLAFSGFIAKAQCIRIYVAELIQGAEIPVERRTFEITISDTMKLNLTSGNNGLLGRISLQNGKYKVKIQNPEYVDAIMNDVVVEESKSTNITMHVVPIGSVKEDEKKKAEKK